MQLWANCFFQEITMEITFFNMLITVIICFIYKHESYKTVKYTKEQNKKKTMGQTKNPTVWLDRHSCCKEVDFEACSSA